MLSAASSSGKKSFRVIDSNVQRILKSAATTYKEDQDIQGLLAHHSIITEKLEEKMRDLLESAALINEFKAEEQRLEKVLRKYSDSNFLILTTADILKGEILEAKDKLVAVSESSNYTSGLLMLSGYKSEDEDKDDILRRQSMLEPPTVVAEELDLLSKTIPVTFSLIHDLVYGDHSAKVDCNKSNVTPEVLELLVMSSIISAYIPSYKSRFAYMFQRYLNDCVKASAGAKRLIDVLPGCYSLSSVTRFETIELEGLMNSGLSVDLKKNLYLAVYDNIQLRATKKTDAGNVDSVMMMDTSGNGDGTIKKKTQKTVEVRTCCQFDIFKDVEHLASLQTDPLSTPFAIYKKFPMENVPADAMDIHDAIRVYEDAELADSNPSGLSDKQYIDFEFQFQALLAIDEVMRSNTWKSQSRGNSLLEEMGVEVDSVSKQKFCIEGCNRANLNRSGKCVFCLKKLKTMSEIQKSQKKQKLTHTSVTDCGESRDIDEGDHMILQFSPKSKAESMETKLFFQNLVPNTYPYELLNINMVDEDIIECKTNNSIEKLILPLLDVNPAEHSSIKLIQERFLEMLGHKKDGGIMSMFVCSNAGATILSEYLRDEIDIFHILIGLGHVEMAVTRLSMKVVIAAFGEDFVKAHSFKSEKAIQYLLSCKPNHKSFTFIQLCNAVLHVELVNQFFLREYEKKNSNAASGKDYSEIGAGTREEVLKDFLDNFINSADLKDDSHLQNAIFVCQVLSNCLLLRKAMRANEGKGDTFAIDAAIKSFMPLFYKCGFTTYAPLLHKQYIDLRFRSTPALRQAKRLLSIVEGQGPDFGMEQTIQSALRNRKGQKGNHLQRSLMNLNSQFIFKNNFRNMVSNTKLKASKRRIRTLKNRDEDFSQFSLIFRSHNTLKYVKGRNEITSFDMKYNWISGVSLRSVWDLGQAEMRKNQVKSVEHPNPFQDHVGLSVKFLQGNEIIEPGTEETLDNFNLDKENEAVRILRNKSVVGGKRRAAAEANHNTDDYDDDGDDSVDDDSDEVSSDGDDDDDDDDGDDGDDK